MLQLNDHILLCLSVGGTENKFLWADLQVLVLPKAL